MVKGTLFYEGKAKKLFRTNDSAVVWAEYLNQATALNGVKKDQINGKGELNNQITAYVFDFLKTKGINNHFIKRVSSTEQLIQSLAIIPLEVVVRNVAAGSFSKRLGIAEGKILDQPIIEFYYKDDSLDDPMVIDAHITYLGLASDQELEQLRQLALKINQALKELFDSIEIVLIDFKVEFGRQKDGTILLADEISPDTCRLWDKKTNEHLDKDIYRRDLGDIVPVYQEVLNRLEKRGK
ncbi:phosphoribosylaminoimidazolesuccinocarboxamide synthase [Enterococcus hermanniensis]|uniref:Phosphoribosylaminoimidazole-succinocarboxamide synthase n=1 Tax=Enterococcus hermanniensis TaxID=249189 RepID=A0A1L8TL50_9ENTE|nr:phosphoribosylaminoimidazolesuccinocarboxamide synthase [Enterococcus hermanniensis]OJG45010.1 phosphoribosylaminoimidazolesuccinocarboxamide synthase [Enterococcus hermanniensis]